MNNKDILDSNFLPDDELDQKLKTKLFENLKTAKKLSDTRRSFDSDDSLYQSDYSSHTEHANDEDADELADEEDTLLILTDLNRSLEEFDVEICYHEDFSNDISKNLNSESLNSLIVTKDENINPEIEIDIDDQESRLINSRKKLNKSKIKETEDNFTIVIVFVILIIFITLIFGSSWTRNFSSGIFAVIVFLSLSKSFILLNFYYYFYNFFCKLTVNFTVI